MDAESLMSGGIRVLLVNMPVANPVLPNLAIEQLAQIARREGHVADVLYGSLLMPPVLCCEFFYGMSGQAIFAPDYFGLDDEDFAYELRDALAAGSPAPANPETREANAFSLMLAIEGATTCLDRCMDRIPAGGYDIVAFSVAFDAQKLPSAALARRLKARETGIRILFGGTGCDGAMGSALLERFPEIDVVMRGEADALFVPGLEALTGRRPMESVPQLVWRRGDHLAESADQAPFDGLDKLPFPDYGSFLQQRAGSVWGKGPLILMFESSRGCWWGSKQHCEFCGIRAVRLGFRSRSSKAVLEQIRRLGEGYGADIVYSTDAILDIVHLREMLPVLARDRQGCEPGFSLFYEIKSNVKRSELALMAAAGVLTVQPGIESFSTDALKRIGKGATALQQVQTVKWCTTYGINPIYGILLGLPGETATELQGLVALVGRLHHLRPPVDVNPLALHAFSPYAENPERYGIHGIRPFELQRLIYRCDDELLARLCYELDFETCESGDPEIAVAQDALRSAVAEWKSAYAAGAKLTVQHAAGSAIIVRRSANGRTRIDAVRGLEAQVLAACESIQSIGRMAAALGMAESAVADTAGRLEAEGLLIQEGQRALSLAVPTDADAWTDARLAAESLPAEGAAAAPTEVQLG